MAKTKKVDGARQLTLDECRQRFLNHLLAVAKDCATNPSGGTTFDRITLAIFSTLVAIDGGSFALPSFELRPMPHADDKAYCKGEGRNWWPNRVDISDGELHSRWAQMTPRSSVGQERVFPKDEAAGSSPAGVTKDDRVRAALDAAYVAIIQARNIIC